MCYQIEHIEWWLDTYPISLILLDTRLCPSPSPLETVNHIATLPTAPPILVLTDRVKLVRNAAPVLRTGAADILLTTLPTSLLARRIKTSLAALQPIVFTPASQTQQKPTHHHPHSPAVTIHPYQPVARIHHHHLHLRRKEYLLLRLLIGNHCRLITRQSIRHHVWESDKYVSDNTLDVTIKQLRDKIHPTLQHQAITTVHGLGYRWQCHSPNSAP